MGIALEDTVTSWKQTIGPVKKVFADQRLTFSVVSVVLAFSLAIAPAKDFFSQWRHWQNGYLALVRTRSDGDKLQRRLQRGIQQIWIPSLGVVDRCTTCHVGLQEASLTNVSTQPYRKHPYIPHSVTQYGCTYCHGGQGVSTTVEEAHQSTDAWEQPLLPARFLQAGCGQCHWNALPGTPQLNLGRQLLRSYGCVRCHSVHQPDGSILDATDDPPPLSHIASKTTREWIYAWLKDPQAYSATATMPNFKLTDADARDISAFLISQSTPPPNPHSPDSMAANTGHTPAAASASTEGASLYGQSFCASCHAVQNAAGMFVGGDFGPELTRIGSKAKPEWLRTWIENPHDYQPGTRMPRYRFDVKQVETLTSFLLAKSDPDFLSNVHLEPPTPEQVTHGKLLATEYGCAACHVINGIKRPENFAPDLSRIGSKSRAQIMFPAGMERETSTYIVGKIRDPRSFGTSLKMPQFTLSTRQTEAITTALLAQTDRAFVLPTAYRVPAKLPGEFQPAGRAARLIEDMQCFSCHRINGRGGDMAPDLSWEGSSVQRTWLDKFLKEPNTLRPALIRRMPKLNMTAEEIRVLGDYMMAVLQTPTFDSDSFSLQATPQAIEQGRQLYYGKFACQSCHIADYNKDKGYVGPALAQVGERLQPVWIYHWLKNPDSLRPGTLEPNYQMTDEEARSVTAFLASLKGTGKKEASKAR